MVAQFSLESTTRALYYLIIQTGTIGGGAIRVDLLQLDRVQGSFDGRLKKEKSHANLCPNSLYNRLPGESVSISRSAPGHQMEQIVPNPILVPLPQKPPVPLMADRQHAADSEPMSNLYAGFGCNSDGRVQPNAILPRPNLSESIWDEKVVEKSLVQKWLPEERLAGEAPRQGEVLELGNLEPSIEQAKLFLNDQDTFIARVSHIPFISETIRAYEYGKQRSLLLKYSAATVEFSVKKLCKPVVSVLEPNLEIWDSYACKQLNVLEQNYPVLKQSPQTMYQNSKMTIQHLLNKFAHDQLNRQLPREMLAKTRDCIEFLKSAEIYINFLISKLQTTLAESPIELETQLLLLSGQVTTHRAEAQLRISELSVQVRDELIALIRQTLDIINHSTSLLPVQAREMLKRLILGLPQKFFGSQFFGQSPIDNVAVHTQKVLLFAHESTIMIKSMVGILSTYVGALPREETQHN